MLSGFKKLRYGVEEALVRSCASLLGTLSPQSWDYISRKAGDAGFRLLKKRREIAIQNIERAFGSHLVPSEKNDLAQKAFQHAVLSVLELYGIEKILPHEKERFQISGLENFQAGFSGGKGLIVAAAHLGSWEYLSFICRLSGHPGAVVVKPIRNPHINATVQKLRAKPGLLPIEKNKAATKTVLRELAQNHAVAILIDQWAGPEGLWTKFFGEATSTTSMPARLSAITGAPIVFAYCLRKEPGFYEIKISEPITALKKDSTGEREITERLNLLLEAEIRAHPAQWLWGHSRWKPKPSTLREI